MKHWKINGLFVLVFGLILIFPPLAAAQHGDNTPPDYEKECAKAADKDERNLCLAFHPIPDPENRYKHKNHSNYYCSLIRNRDKQNYCYAVLDKHHAGCDLIVDKTLAADCDAKTK